MNALALELTIFGEPVFLVALIALAAAALQGERVWSRSRRRHGLEPGAVAYLLDGLVIVCIGLAFAAGATLFVQGLKSIAMLLGGVIDGERVGLLIVGMALALGLAFALVRIASRRRAAQAVAGVGLPNGLDMSAVDASMGSVLAQQAYESQREPFEDEQPLAMTQQRWKPSVTSAAGVPTSFLDLVEPPAIPQRQARSRFALATTLLSLALVVMLVSGAVVFRHQLMNILLGMEANYGTAGSSASFGQTNAGAETAAANVGAAAAPVASAPTAASLPTPAAPLSASDAQGTQKRVKSVSLNLRAQPGTSQDILVVLKQGDLVTMFTDFQLLQGATWVKVRVGANEGWVDQSLLE
ncbi:MAG: SH3 domain-containing protein [Roseiflexaceae bacterium]